MLFNFLHTVLQLAKFCLLPEFENIPNFPVFFSIYQCHASDFSIKRKNGHVQETMISEKLPNPRNWKLQLFMRTRAKEPKGKKIERNTAPSLLLFAGLSATNLLQAEPHELHSEPCLLWGRSEDFADSFQLTSLRCTSHSQPCC